MKQRSALLVSLTYAAFGTIWILASDHILGLLVQDAAQIATLQTYKGWAFIAITALLLYALIRRRGDELPNAQTPPRMANTNNGGHVMGMVAFATFLLIAVILANLIYNVLDERRGLIEAAERSAQNLAQVLEEQTQGMVTAVDLTLTSAARIVESDRPALVLNNTQVADQLRAGLKSASFIRTIFVVDATGRLMHHTDKLPPANIDFSDREYFQVHRDSLTVGLHIGHPLTAPTSNVWSIHMSKRLSYTDGRFAGVVVAAVEPEYLERFYKSISVGPGGVVSLLLRDGTMLVRSPHLAGAIGKDFRESPLFMTHLPKAEFGTYQAPSRIDSSTRIFSYRVLRGMPLVVVIGLDRDEVLSKWLSRAWIHGLASASFMLIIAWLGYLMYRELRRRDLLSNALRTSEERFRKVLDDMMEGCQVIGFDWQYRYVNDSVLQHNRRARAELLGHTMMDVHPGFEKTEMFSAMRRCMQERTSQGLQTRFDYGDDSFSWFDVSIQPVPEGIFVLSIDITSQKLAEERLRQLNDQLETRVIERTAALDAANKELEAFSASVSHDLRAPLRHLDGFARLAMERTHDADEKTRDYLSKIVKASEKMRQLIDDLLALSRASRAELNTRPVDLQTLVSGVKQECLSYAGRRDVEWRLDTLPRVQGDLVLLRQVFMNLISNAVKFTRNSEHAIIEVRARLQENNEVEISVRDNGAGFDMAFADKLYGVFQRLHNEREFEGTGIGLAIVRRIIGRHGGKTWAEGAPGKGAVFYLTLKCVSAEVA